MRSRQANFSRDVPLIKLLLPVSCLHKSEADRRLPEKPLLADLSGRPRAPFSRGQFQQGRSFHQVIATVKLHAQERGRLKVVDACRFGGTSSRCVFREANFSRDVPFIKLLLLLSIVPKSEADRRLLEKPLLADLAGRPRVAFSTGQFQQGRSFNQVIATGKLLAQERG